MNDFAVRAFADDVLMDQSPVCAAIHLVRAATNGVRVYGTAVHMSGQAVVTSCVHFRQFR
jgi:hypothetical protein